VSISQTLCTSFKQQLLLGVHDFRVGGDTFKLALYTTMADLGAGTTAYTTSGEISGTGYSAGGITLTSLGASAADGTGFISFANATFSGASFTAYGALIYNTTPSALGPTGGTLVNPAVCVLDFGGARTVTANNFVIQFPANNAANAIVRVG
jgi:hypothetical protein